MKPGNSACVSRGSDGGTAARQVARVGIERRGIGNPRRDRVAILDREIAALRRDEIIEPCVDQSVRIERQHAAADRALRQSLRDRPAVANHAHRERPAAAGLRRLGRLAGAEIDHDLARLHLAMLQRLEVALEQRQSKYPLAGAMRRVDPNHEHACQKPSRRISQSPPILANSRAGSQAAKKGGTAPLSPSDCTRPSVMK